MPVRQPPGLAEHRHQRRRQHQVAQPQLRRQRLGERADVEHPAIRIHGLQRIDRPLAIAEFAVVVVLHDPGTVLPGPLQQFHPPGHGQHTAQRKLVRRRHVGQPHSVTTGQPGRVQPLGVHRHGEQPGPNGLETLAGHRITRLLEDKRISGLQQQPRTKVQRLLGAVHDEDLPGITHQPPRPGEVALQRPAQGRVAFGLGVIQPVLLAQQFSLVHTPPGQRGKVTRGHSAIKKIDGRCLLRRRRLQRHPRHPLHAAAPCRQRWHRGGRRRIQPSRRHPCRQRCGHTGRTARSCHQKTLGHQLLVGRGDGAARHPQVGRQRTGRGHPGARGQRAVRHLGPQERIDPAPASIGAPAAVGLLF